MTLTKSLVDKLLDPDIKHSEYLSIIKLIDERFSEICRTLLKNRKLSWFDYDNHGDDENSPGKFSMEEYDEYIRIGGEHNGLKEPFGYEFPTRWLWEDDYVDQYNAEVDKYNKQLEEEKNQKKQKDILNKEKRKKMIEQIKSKLTKEELSYISFK